MNVQRILGITAALLLSTGCSKEGIWVIRVEAPPINLADECDEEVKNHNYAGAEAPVETDDPDPWTTEDIIKVSDQIVLAQFTEKGGQATLIVGDTVYPSIAGKGDTWTFEWTAGTTVTYEAQNALGYSCLEEVTQNNTVTFDITFDGKTLTGSTAAKSDFVAKYEETDRWQQGVSGDEMCTNPVGNYLEVLTGRGRQAQYDPASNSQNSVDCTAEPCTLTVEQHCTDNYTLTGYESGMNGEPSYGPTDDDGQTFGSF